MKDLLAGGSVIFGSVDGLILCGTQLGVVKIIQ